MSEKSIKILDKKDAMQASLFEEGKHNVLSKLNYACSDVVSMQNDYNSKNIAAILSKRQAESLSILDSVSLTEEKTVQKKSAFTEFLLSPGVSFILGCATMVSIVPNLLSQHVILPLVISLSFTVQSLLRARFDIIDCGKKSIKAKLDSNAVDRFVSASQNAIIQDTETIKSLFNASTNDNNSNIEDIAVNQFCILYEAALDNPKNNDFSYSLTLARKMLSKLNITEVPYSKEKQNLFLIDNVEYPSQMRCPALVRKDNNSLVKMGEYIQDCRLSGGN